MPDEFKAEVFQNQFLPLGSSEVHAIMTVTAGQTMGAQAAGRLFGILCDVSGSMDGVKILAARAAMTKLVTMLPEDCCFFIVTGSDSAKLVCPVAVATPTAKDRAIAAIRQIRADGGTTISVWLDAALQQFRTQPGALKQALLLTDGQNDEMDGPLLQKALAACEGAFQCDCRGVGTDWKVDQLRLIANKLLGTTDIIPAPAQIETDFQAILSKALANRSVTFSCVSGRPGRQRAVLQRGQSGDCRSHAARPAIEAAGPRLSHRRMGQERIARFPFLYRSQARCGGR